MSRVFRIVAVDRIAEWVAQLYRAELPSDEYGFFATNNGSVNSLLGELKGADTLVARGRPVTAEIMDAAGPDLKLIQVQGRTAHVVDLEEARARGVPVAVMPHRGAIAVAEQAIALMLAVYRQVITGHRRTIGGDYRELGVEPIETNEREFAFNWLKLDGVRELYGKVLGLVGFGSIGQEVAHRAKAFDMEVLYTKRKPLPSAADRVLGVRWASFEELLEVSHVVSLHAPHTESTERMIDAAALDRMKEGSILINTARGGLVDEEALVRVLRQGGVAGAGLDVFRREPLPADHPLLSCNNLVLSPHIGGGSGGGQRGSAADVIQNIVRLAEGGALRFRVDDVGDRS